MNLNTWESSTGYNKLNLAVAVGTTGSSVTIAATDATATETAGNTGTFTVTIAPASATATTVKLTYGGTATSGSDYTALAASVTVPAGSTTATLTVTPVDDAVYDGSETVITTVAAGTGYSVGSPASGTVTITDNESAPSITSQPANKTVTAPATATFTATASGNPTPMYQWQSAPSGSSTFTALSGATAASYTTGATSTGMSGTQYRCVATNSAGSVTSTAATLTVSGLPTGWSTADIGAVAATGSASVTSGVWTVKGSGADIWGTLDGFRLVSMPATGDLSITARVTGLTVSNAWAKAGVMVRETTAAGSRHAFTCLTGSNGSAYQRRFATGGSSTHTGGPAWSAPTWVRLERVGTTFISSVSANGNETVPVATITVTDATCSETGPDAGVFTVTLSAALPATVTVAYSLTGRAVNGGDYTALGGSLVIPVGSTTGTITIVPSDDTKYEKSETVIATLHAGTGYTVGGAATATLSILDNDGLNQPAGSTLTTVPAPVVSTVSTTYTAPTNAETPSTLATTWTWGDGTTTSGAPGTSTVHVYAIGGVYTVTATITDPSNGQSVVETFTVTVSATGSGNGNDSGPGPVSSNGGGGSGGCGMGSGLGLIGLVGMLLLRLTGERRRG